jgi:DNA-binding winged helix-turn-helix (wHTH) protein
MELNLPLEANSADKPVLCFGEFQLDRQLRTLRRGAEQLKLAAKPFATLEFLIENRSRVVPKSELLREVWGAQQEVNTVEQAVRHVRKALADGPLKPRYIETTPGQGYRFIADVHGQEPDAPMLRQEGRRPSRRDVLIAAGVGAPLVCLGGFAAVRLLWRPEHVARVAINGTSLIATSATGSILWTYGFNEPLAEAPAETAGWRTQMVDLNADGQPESLVTVAFASAPAHPAEILCFTSTGKLLWRYRPQVAGLRFNKRDLNGPWKFTDVVLVPGMPTAIWAAVAHDVWWPSLVIRLSDTGMHELALVNSGVIFKLHAFQNGTGSYIMAAGVNNEYQLAALAILRSSGPPATSPQNDEGSDFYCVAGCPKVKRATLPTISTI